MEIAGHTLLLRMMLSAMAASASACAAAVTPLGPLGDGGTDGDGGVDAASPTGPDVVPTQPIPFPAQGGVFLANFMDSNAHGYAYAFAEFYPRPEAGGISCTQTAGDGCTVSVCNNGGDAGAALDLLSAGDIEVTAPDGYSFLLDDTMSAARQYPGQDLPVPWVIGNDVSIRALGGMVSAFSTNLNVPGGPVLNRVGGHMPGSAMSARRTSALEVQWMPVADSVELALHPSYDAFAGTPTGYACPMLCPTSVSVRCRVDGNLGTANISPATLASVPTGVPMYLDVYGIAERTLAVGGLTVTVDLVNRVSQTQPIQFQ